MKKVSYLLAALMVVALGTGVATVTSSPAYAQAEADKEKGPSIRAEMGKLYQEVQAALNSKDYTAATDKVNAMAALDKITPYESYTVQRLRAAIAMGKNDQPAVIAAMESMLGSEFLSPAERKSFTSSVAGTYFNTKQYPKAREWATKYLQLDAESVQMRNLIARTYYLENDFANCAKYMEEILAADAKTGAKPSEENLRLTYSAYQNAKDNANSVRMLEKMAEFYPQKETWADLVYRLKTRPGFSDRLLLDAYRIQFATDNVEEGAEYVDMAELAMLAGLPVEAKIYIDAGFEKKVVGAGKDAVKQKQLRDRIHKQAADDVKALDAGESTAKNAKTGVGLVNIGYNYVVNNQVERGIALMEQGIAKGGLKSLDEAKLHLGMAYLKVGNRDKAKEIFAGLQGTDGSAELGRYWLLVQAEAKK